MTKKSRNIKKINKHQQTSLNINKHHETRAKTHSLGHVFGQNTSSEAQCGRQRRALQRFGHRWIWGPGHRGGDDFLRGSPVEHQHFSMGKSTFSMGKSTVSLGKLQFFNGTITKINLFQWKILNCSMGKSPFSMGNSENHHFQREIPKITLFQWENLNFQCEIPKITLFQWENQHFQWENHHFQWEIPKITLFQWENYNFSMGKSTF